MRTRVVSLIFLPRLISLAARMTVAGTRWRSGAAAVSAVPSGTAVDLKERVPRRHLIVRAPYPAPDVAEGSGSLITVGRRDGLVPPVLGGVIGHGMVGAVEADVALA